MANPTARRVESDLAIHPGELLAEELAGCGITQRALAAAMGRPVQAINEIVNGKKAITAETAIQLEDAIEIPAHLWLNMQTDHDLIVARRTARASVPRPRSSGRAARP